MTTRAIVVALGTGAFITSAAALGISANEPAMQELDKPGYEASLRAASNARIAALARCEALAANDRDYCRTEAQALDVVRVAEIEQSYRRTEQSARALQRARIDARYQVDRARCAGVSGGVQREKCLVKAHAARGRALLQAAAPYEKRM